MSGGSYRGIRSDTALSPNLGLANVGENLANSRDDDVSGIKIEPTIKVRFTVRARHVKGPDRVLIIGDHEMLGEWNFNRGVLMKLALDEQTDGIWEVTINVPRTVAVLRYRYVIATPLECCFPKDPSTWRVKSWECYRKARRKFVVDPALETPKIANPRNNLQLGILNRGVDLFGSHDGYFRVDEFGWLTKGVNLVQLKLVRNDVKFAPHFAAHHHCDPRDDENFEFRIRVTSFAEPRVEHGKNLDTGCPHKRSPGNIPADQKRIIGKMNGHAPFCTTETNVRYCDLLADPPKFKTQPHSGALFKSKSYLMFEKYFCDGCDLGFIFQLIADCAGKGTVINSETHSLEQPNDRRAAGASGCVTAEESTTSMAAPTASPALPPAETSRTSKANTNRPYHEVATSVSPEHAILGFGVAQAGFLSDNGDESCVRHEIVLRSPICGKVVGTLDASFLVIKPVRCAGPNGKVPPLDCLLARDWQTETWTGLDVGHRGTGMDVSFKDSEHVHRCRENTLLAFKVAADHGADMLEFDIQLTKDEVPVIFHDFFVKTSPDETKRLDSLTCEDLVEMRKSRREHIQRSASSSIAVSRSTEDSASTCMLLGHEDCLPFPCLESAFRTITPDVGFNLEVKYPQALIDDTTEMPNPMDLNRFADLIISRVEEYNTTGRVILYSCFHPDMCVALRMKQNRYPVMFLTMGATLRWTPYCDVRTRSLAIAIQFAASYSLIGVACMCDDILLDPSVVRIFKEKRLACFCWGEQGNNPTVTAYLKRLGVHGVIYDCIDVHLHHTGKKKKGIFANASTKPGNQEWDCEVLPSMAKRRYSV